MNDSRYNFAPNIEGLAAQVYHAVKKTGIDKIEDSKKISFDDATIDILYRKNLIIVVTFNQNEVSESEREEEQAKEQQEEESGWKVVVNKKHTTNLYYFFHNVSKSGFFVFDQMVTNIDTMDKEQVIWSHAYCKEDNQIYEYHYQTCYAQFNATQSYIEQFNEWFKTKDTTREFYLFQEVSSWRSWKFIDVCSGFKDVCQLLKVKKLEWSHVFEPSTGNVWDFRVKTDGKIYGVSQNVTQEYTERFHEYMRNRKNLDKFPKN
jgi:hypothetical protein